MAYGRFVILILKLTKKYTTFCYSYKGVSNRNVGKAFFSQLKKVKMNLKNEKTYFPDLKSPRHGSWWGCATTPNELSEGFVWTLKLSM